MATSDGQRFKLTVAYDGRNYAGWQSQPGGNTIQDILLDALQSICPEIQKVQGSGRTDAGVSADGQVAHFDAPADWSMQAPHWLRALNTKLPRSIRIMKAESVSLDFHAQYGAKEKTYCYRIFTGEVLPPLLLGLAWHCPNERDFESLEKVVSAFEGTHDFRAFSAKRNDGKDEVRDTTRTIYSAKVNFTSSEEFELEFTGNGFLYKMVRLMVGASIQVCRGKRDLDQIREQLKSGIGSGKAPLCAPSDGLRLVKVRYPT